MANVTSTTAQLLDVKLKLQKIASENPGDLRLGPAIEAVDRVIIWLSNPEKHFPFAGEQPRAYRNALPGEEW